MRTLLSLFLAALAALPAVDSPSPATSGSTVPGAPRCAARVVPVLRWTGGFEATMTITNLGATPMHAWYATWMWPDGVRMSEVWNGVAMVSGPVAMIHAPSWHSPLAPGETASAGLLATGDPPATELAVQCG